MLPKDAAVIVQDMKQLHRGKVFSLQQDMVTFPNGNTARIDVIRHPGAAAVVPLLDESHVILIHQYRHALRKFIWEIPAGTLSRKEDPLDCARRELREETGYDPGDLRDLGHIVPVPGYSDERVYLYLAMDLRRSSQHLDEDELLDVTSVPFARALDMIDGGEIVDAKTIIGLLRAKAYLATS